MANEPTARSVVRPAGAKVRFQMVGNDGATGMLWVIATKSDTGDVYISSQEGKRWVHVSLHESGRWHYAISRDGMKFTPDIEAPYLGVVLDHEETAPGWIHAMTIAVAKSELLEHRVRRTPEPVVEVPFHPDYPAVAIEIYLQGTNVPPLLVREGFPIANMALGDGRVLAVFAVPQEVIEAPRMALAFERAQADRELRDLGWDGSPTSIAIFFGADGERGYLLQVELVVGGSE